MGIKTVIFDMDGVIVDTEPVHHYAYHEHFKQLNIDVSPELYASFTGNSTKNVYEKLKAIFGIDTQTPDLIQVKRGLFNNAFDTKKDLYLLEGVEDLIKELHSAGIQLILASSAAKVTIDRVFTRFGLYPYFSHIVSGEDFPKSKPDPAIFVEAWRLSGHQKSACIVIEDSTNGVRAAKAAGLFCIGYVSENSKAQDLSQADIIIEHFNQVDSEMLKRIGHTMP
ncbi:HAD family hydrolase [Flavobacterium selenitireducens]|uniref:HAD family hydrolase n=1 Tax=Flavobacterium selenitireducens TaxID=2722704 RepID=UPI00168AF53B|nr:HAD family hydrolase [Flavobacterium selenitireducens]MBD3581114.1 HAD family hydrolase [Flavobacterium selenitireducens]